MIYSNIKKLIKISKDHFGTKLIPENQEITFCWENYTEKTANVLSKLIILNDLYTVPDKYVGNDFEDISNHAYYFLRYYSSKIFNDFSNINFNQYLPYQVNTYKETQRNYYFYFTHIFLIENVINYRYENRIPINDRLFFTFLTILSYNLPHSYYNLFNSTNGDINFTKEITIEEFESTKKLLTNKIFSEISQKEKHSLHAFTKESIDLFYDRF